MKEKIFCRTNEERDNVLKRLEKMGCKWKYGHDKPTKFKNVLDAPVILCVENKLLMQNDLTDYNFFNAKDWLDENSKYKEGDLFQIKPDIGSFPNEAPMIISGMIEDAGKIVTFEDISISGYLQFKESIYSWLEKWVNPIKEVQRKARPGEFVKIVDAYKPNKNDYKDGDILKIIDVDCSGDVQYGKSGKQWLVDFEYVVLEGYEDCDQVKNFKNFVPHLKHKGKYAETSYGIIGEDTPIKDAVDRPLKVGDTVEIYHKGKYDSECVIVKDDELAICYGLQMFMPQRWFD